ncbi:MAG: FAD:protein FMN transferase [Firmicutes bacterium]|nr:FAD:protein FMN transferase [Bacillota bacterium]
MNRKIRFGLASLTLAFCLMLLTGCGGAADDEMPSAVKDINAMDTTMTLTAYNEDADLAQEAVDAAAAEVERLDAMLSTGNKGSEIAKLNKDGEATLSEDSAYLVKRALEIHDSTGGAFDISVYPLMVEWGFTTKEFKVPSDERIAELLQNVNADKIEFDEDTAHIKLPKNMQIDLGGIAKGYTSARIMDIFKEHGIEHGLVSLGGNVQLLGNKPNGNLWKVAIEAPEDDASDYAGVLEAADCAVITSGGYERFFEADGVRYHHIIDPSTGRPANAGLSSVSIVSEDGTLADGLSTSLYIMGEEYAVKYWQDHSDEFEIILVRDDGSVIISSGLEDVFTTERPLDVIK